MKRLQTLKLGLVALVGLGAGVAYAETPVNDPNLVVVDKSDAKLFVDCSPNIKLVVKGTRNKVMVGGTCGSVTVEGEHNTVKMETAKTLKVTGSSNKVSYFLGMNHEHKPEIIKEGSNEVEQVKNPHRPD